MDRVAAAVEGGDVLICEVVRRCVWPRQHPDLLSKVSESDTGHSQGWGAAHILRGSGLDNLRVRARVMMSLKISAGIEIQGLAFFVRDGVRANGHGPVAWREQGQKHSSRQHYLRLMHSKFGYSVGDASEARVPLLLLPHVAKASEAGPDPERTSHGVSLSAGKAPRQALGTVTLLLRSVSARTAPSGMRSLAFSGRPCGADDPMSPQA